MAGFVVGLNAWANYKVTRPVLRDDVPAETFVTTLAFSNLQTLVSFDLTSDDRTLDFSLCSAYIDNSAQNSVPLILTVQGTGQRILVKANWQGYYPIISSGREEAGSNLAIQVSAPTAGPQVVLVPVFLLNYMVEPFGWPTV